MLGSASLLGCYGPTETETNGSSELYIPAECKEIVSLTHEYRFGWSMTCKDDDDRETFYSKKHYEPGWKKYSIVRK